MKTKVVQASTLQKKMQYGQVKTAKMRYAVVEFTCPHCGEHLSNEDGSHLFQLHEIPEQFQCDCCTEWSKPPARAKKLKQGGK